ncbi:MAG: N-acetylmuramoyl-L-alanine amidase [Clostridium sp.]|uniref:N-acetylmuramoyl-L-alanine amidase n=1 Tax=Clostridium sp. TaxID=1506 RepID=UPI00306864D2
MGNKKVFSGVGHGGNDGGAVANGMKESDVNLTMALACNKVLTSHCVPNPMSRYRDENDPLEEEIKEANASGAAIAIDFHNNAGGGDGFEAYYSIGDVEGKELAQCIEKHVVALGQNSRGVKTKVGDGGKDYFGFIRETSMTAIIIESFFLDSADYEIADTIDEQRAFGVAIAKGILEYLGIEYMGEDITNGSTPGPKLEIDEMSHEGKEEVDNKITVYAHSTDPNVLYKYFYELNGEWTTVTDWQESNNCSFMPRDKGIYKVVCHVKYKSNTTDTEDDYNFITIDIKEKIVQDSTKFRVVCGTYSKKENAVLQQEKLKEKGFESFLVVIK